MGEKGNTIVAAVVGAFLLMSAVFFGIRATVSSDVARRGLRNRVRAQAYAIELIEFFRSHTPEQARRYFGANAGAPGTAYPFCAHVNILDRGASVGTNPVVLNPENVAQLPPNNRFSFTDGSRAPNRYYQVHVLDISTMTTRADLCGNTANDVCFAGIDPLCVGPAPIALQPNERFMVTVGVSWVNPSQKSGQQDREDRVVLSTIISEN